MWRTLPCLLLLVPAMALAQTRNNSIGNIQPNINTTVNPSTTSQGGVGQGGTAQGGQGGTSGANAAANPASTASSGSSAVSIQTGPNTIPSDTILRSAPTVYIPSVSTGNVCALGASGGGSFIAGSFGFGVSWESMQCERRQAAALLWNMGTPEARAAAKEVLCNTKELRDAYRTVGSPCATDMQRVEGPTQPIQVSSPQFVVVPKPSAPPAPAVQRSQRSSDPLSADVLISQRPTNGSGITITKKVTRPCTGPRDPGPCYQG